MRELLARLIDWTRRGKLQRELADELRFHRQHLERDAIREGNAPEDARDAASRRLGNVTRVEEDAWERWSWPALDHVLQDIRFSGRQMRRRPVLGMAIVATIGLGLGAAAAIVTITMAALVEPLPYAEPERLAHLWEQRTGSDERSPTSWPTLLDWRARANGFSALEGYDPSNLTIGVGDEARMMRGAQVTPGFFQLLGAPTAAGRQFGNDDETSGTSPVIVSDRFVRATAGDARAGSTITVNGAPHVIIGALPPTFHFALLQDADVFVPLALDQDRRTDRSERSIHVVGRLRPGMPLATARAELARVMAELGVQHPDALTGRTVAAVGLRDAQLRNVKPILGTLLLAAALLIVIMAANLALLMSTRYIARRPELEMRATLGATRGRLLRQLLVESLALSVAGAMLAMVAGHLLTRRLIVAIPESVRISMPYLESAGIDARTGGVVVAVAVLLAAAFGLGPALITTKSRTRAGDVRTTVARGERRLRRSLVAAQVSLTVVLLVSSGLLVTSFANLLGRDLGFTNPETLVSARVPLSGARYQDPAAQQRFYETLIERVATLPGVRSVAAIDEVPSGGSGGGAVTFEDEQQPLVESARPRAALRIVGGGYFATMGIRMLDGRTFSVTDDGDAPRVAVVSSGLARNMGGEAAVVGRRLRLEGNGDAPWEIIGVVDDVQVGALDAETPPVVYLSHLQRAENRLVLVLRTENPATSVASQLRDVVKAMDGGVPVYAVSTIERQMRDSRALFSRRFPLILCAVFATAALVLTLVALYAVCLHEVVTRHREFGIRLALGGSPRSVRALVMRDAAILGIVGVAVGVIVAGIASRAMEAVLYGVAPADWRVYGLVAAGVLVAALLASLWPALRAGSVEPSIVMRAE